MNLTLEGSGKRKVTHKSLINTKTKYLVLRLENMLGFPDFMIPLHLTTAIMAMLIHSEYSKVFPMSFLTT